MLGIGISIGVVRAGALGGISIGHVVVHAAVAGNRRSVGGVSAPPTRERASTKDALFSMTCTCWDYAVTLQFSQSHSQHRDFGPGPYM
jgi:hypothetical protein